MHLIFLQNMLRVTFWSSPKLLKSCGGFRFLILPECGDFFIYTSYFKLACKYTSFVLYGRTFNSFVALLAELSETLLS